VYARSLEETGKTKVKEFIARLFGYYVGRPDLLPGASGRTGAEAQRQPELVRSVADYIAGMTDRFAERAYVKAFLPGSWPE